MNQKITQHLFEPFTLVLVEEFLIKNPPNSSSQPNYSTISVFPDALSHHLIIWYKSVQLSSKKIVRMSFKLLLHLLYLQITIILIYWHPFNGCASRFHKYSTQDNHLLIINYGSLIFGGRSSSNTSSTSRPCIISRCASSCIIQFLSEITDFNNEIYFFLWL